LGPRDPAQLKSDRYSGESLANGASHPTLGQQLA
jgi:hypothetical protein